MKKLLASFWNEPAVAFHVVKSVVTAGVAAVVLWPLGVNDLVVIATALGLTVPAAVATRSRVKPVAPK